MIDTEDNRNVISTPGCKNNNLLENNNKNSVLNVLMCCLLIRCLDEIVHD